MLEKILRGVETGERQRAPGAQLFVHTLNGLLDSAKREPVSKNFITAGLAERILSEIQNVPPRLLIDFTEAAASAKRAYDEAPVPMVSDYSRIRFFRTLVGEMEAVSHGEIGKGIN